MNIRVTLPGPSQKMLNKITMKDLSVIYPCHNRLYYTQFSLPRLLDECRKCERFHHLYIYDDMSTDGTHEFIRTLPIKRIIGDNYTIIRRRIGNSVFQINHTLDRSNTPYVGKFDNDTLIPTHTFNKALELIDSEALLGFLGIGYHMESPARSEYPKMDPGVRIVPANHIGGIGIFRRRVFKEMGEIKSQKVYFGFTNYQLEAKKRGWKIGWAKGIWVMDLNDSDSYSHDQIYSDKGWGRVFDKKRNSVFQPN